MSKQVFSIRDNVVEVFFEKDVMIVVCNGYCIFTLEESGIHRITNATNCGLPTDEDGRIKDNPKI